MNSTHARSVLDGLDVAEAKRTIIEWLESTAWARHGHLPAARLAVQPPAVLGRAVPDRLRRARPADRDPRRPAAGRPARGARLLAAHVRPGGRALRARAAAGPQRRLGERHARPGRRPEALPAGHQHDAQLGRVVLVLPELPGPGPARRGGRPRARAVLDGARATTSGRRVGRRRPVRRRRRARGAAPAVLPVLAQGAVRPGLRQRHRAVPHAVQPGLHPGVCLRRRARSVRPGGRGRRGRTADGLPLGRPGGAPRVRQDRQVAEERRVARRDVRRVRRGHVPAVRDVDGSAGPVPAVGHPCGCRLPALPAAAVAQRRRRGDRRDRGVATSSRATRRCASCTARSTRSAPRWTGCGSTPRSRGSSCSTTT